MGMRMPETCWAVSKRQAINLRNCCIWLVDSLEWTDKTYSIQIIDLFSYLAKKQDISVNYTAFGPTPRSNTSCISYGCQGLFFPKVKRPWRHADHSTRPDAKFKNEWSYTCNPSMKFVKFILISFSMRLQLFWSTRQSKDRIGLGMF
jgi:hypothetical protein